MNKNKEILEFLIEITDAASKLITDDFSVSKKGEGYDLVTNSDIEVENYLIRKISEKYPDFDIVSEESNFIKSITKNCFVIDPLDGTINFANNLPLWGIQIACIVESIVVAAVIYLPRMKELYYASENGAYLNGIKINSKVVPMINTLYSIDSTNNLPIMEKMSFYSNGRRNLGAVCVSIAFVACGRLHGSVYTRDKPWDYVPGLYIAKMAGAVTLDEPGFHAAAMNEEFLKILKNANDNK